MSIAPLKWTYEYQEIEVEENKIAYCTIYAINHKSAIQFTLVDVGEYFVKQVVSKLNDAMEIQQEEVRRLRNIVCLLEDSRITNMSIHDRPELFADVAEVFRQRNEDTHGHLPVFGEDNGRTTSEEE